MSAPDRPHCRTPGACVAKSEKHCQGCSASRLMRQLMADPEWVAERKRKSDEAHRTERSRAKSAERMAHRHRDDPAFRAAVAENGRKQIAARASDMDVQRRRVEGLRRVSGNPEIIRRRSAALSRSLLKRTARQVGIPIELVPLFREIRDKVKATPTEAKAVVLASPEAKRLAQQIKTAERARAAGPAPAIGTPARAAWTRKINATASEAHPC